MMRDPEINYYYSYRYIVDVIGFKNTKVKLLSSITKPTLILHGKKDSNVYSELSVGFYDLLKSDKKRLKLFDCDHWFYHSIFFNQNDQRYTESDRRQIVDSIVSWLVTL
jgi:dipeptidyl aminopeptidase/acylaminoacyl peptidase